MNQPARHFSNHGQTEPATTTTRVRATINVAAGSGNCDGDLREQLESRAAAAPRLGKIGSPPLGERRLAHGGVFILRFDVRAGGYFTEPHILPYFYFGSSTHTTKASPCASVVPPRLGEPMCAEGGSQ